jgi:hypothetical protein
MSLTGSILEVPGPQDYTLNLKATMRSSPTVSFKAERRSIDHRPKTPGPGSYTITSEFMKRSNSCSGPMFSKELRLKTIIPSTPGAG